VTRTKFRDLPLVWKILVPYVALLVVVGAFGVFLVVRDLRSQAQATLDRDLARRSLDAESFLHERELYVHESANFAANLQGMADVAARGDASEGARLLGSVLALKTDLNLLVVTDASGTPVTAFTSVAGGATPQEKAGTSWADVGTVQEALASGTGGPTFAFVERDGRSLLAVVAPVCTTSSGCLPSGVTIAGIDLSSVTTSALQRAEGTNSLGSGVTLFDANGRRIAVSGAAPDATVPQFPTGKLVRRDDDVNGTAVTTLYAPLDIDGRRQGALAVTLPTGPAFASVRSAAWRVALIVLAAIAGVVGIGAMLSRFILRQVRPLLETNRALGSGDFTARATVLGGDELGELAEGVNQMAEQLETSYETLEQRVRERTEEVERLLQERTDLFTSVSHEFRTPLAVILAQADSLQDASYAKTPQWCDDVGRMVEESGRQLLEFVNDVLELARAEAGGLDVVLEEFRFSELVAEVRESIQSLAAGAGLSLKVRVRRDLTPVLGDRERVREIIFNLIDNAVKYTPTGGKIELTASNGDGRVTVTVSDTGVGIPDDVGDEIFDPFYRVKGTRTQHSEPSSGLGLALTKRLVEAHGGAISFTQRPKGGTTFSFTLPTALQDMTRSDKGGPAR
jgi:signal transduction histidine kinase